jgi:hypothetical protein
VDGHLDHATVELTAVDEGGAVAGRDLLHDLAGEVVGCRLGRHGDPDRDGDGGRAGEGRQVGGSLRSDAGALRRHEGRHGQREGAGDRDQPDHQHGPGPTVPIGDHTGAGVR